MNLETIAQTQYFKRPADECYPSVAALVEHAAAVRDHSAEKTFNTKDLKAEPTERGIVITSPSGASATPTHWAYGQLCRSLGAPASYLRELPVDLQADCINHGLKHTPPASDLRLLLQVPIGGTQDDGLILRSSTTERYSRLWDANLYGPIVDTLIGRDGFDIPPTWDGQPRGAYSSDRDSFVIAVNGGSIVNDPSARGGDGAMYRGVIIRNSEVGASSVWIDRFLFRAICGNHLLMGAVYDRQYRRRHIGSDVARDAIREIVKMAHDWTQQSASRDEQIIRSLIQNEIAATRDAVIDELRKIGFTEDAAERAYTAAEQHEGASPRSFWGIAQGATRISQQTPYQDARYELDKLAALVMARGARRVAV